MTDIPIVLPELDKPCPDCAPDAVQKQMADEYGKWADEEGAAYRKFIATYDGWDGHEAWKKTATYRELADREPTPAGIGCVECNYEQRVLTDAGRQVLAFLNFWRSK